VPTAPAPPSPPSPPSAPAGPLVGQGSSGTISWSRNGEKLEVKYRGEFEFSDDDTDVQRMSPGASLRISDGGWFRGRSVEFMADASGNITRRFWVGSSERAFEPEGRQWLSQMLPRFIRQSGIGAKARAARIFKSQGAAGVLAEIGRIEGSYAKKLYFTELLRMNIDAKTVRTALEQAGREIESDYELATLLIDGGDRLLADENARQAYFAAARTIDSDYEMRRVYASALKRGPVSAPILASMLEASKGIDSDYEHAELLTQVVKQQPIDPVSAPFFAAVDSIGSNYERGRVLQTLLRRSDLSQQSLTAVLRAVGGMSGYEASQVLQAAARGHDITGEARDLYVAAADRLGKYEQSQALAALVRSEKAKR
jgi:hypothetical protein